MDGIHDLGGMEGLGPVACEDNEPVFHAEWERRAIGITVGLMVGGHFGNTSRFRHHIERMDPAWYLVSPYYEHWLTAAASAVVEDGSVTAAELDARLGSPFPLPRPIHPRAAADAGRDGAAPTTEAYRYAAGDRVRVRAAHPFGHTRCPRYVRGKRGVVVRVDGVFSLPDVEAHRDVRRMEPTYSVRFEAGELWGEPGAPVHVDLWQSYLEDA